MPASIGCRSIFATGGSASASQSVTVSNLGRVPEAARYGRRALAMARELGYRLGQVHATTSLVIAARYAGDLDDAVDTRRSSR